MLRFYDWYKGRVQLISAIRRMTSIKWFYRWLKESGQRLDDPAAPIKYQLPKPAPKEPLTVDELRRLLPAVLSERDSALLLILIATGVRRGELAEMRAEHISWERGLILVEGKGLKRRWVAPGPLPMKILRRYLGDRQGPVWLSRHRGKALTRDGVYLVLKRIAERAGIKGVFTHRFRTTFACMFDERTSGDVGSLQLLMGHSKIETSLRYAQWNRAERALAQQQRVSLADAL